MSAEPAIVTVDPALTAKRICEALDVSATYFWRLRRDEKFPPPDLELPGRPGAMPRWRASTVQAWLDARQQHQRIARERAAS